ncbi:MAG: zinc-dependent alcohol dehydrogenase [Limisphaerales bacterium]
MIAFDVLASVPMLGRMQAAVLHGREDMRVEEVQPAKLKRGEVRVRIRAALTCGTDLKVFKRGYHATMIRPPAVFGHELSGEICEMAAGVRGWKLGDRVVVANSAPCGHCFFCKHDQENLCDDLLFLNGAYAESIVVPARLVAKNMLRLKKTTSFRDAALTEPLACAVQGWEDLKMRAGESVLVIGSGPLGLMFVALARNAKCIVTVAGRGEARLKAAKKLGAKKIIDVTGATDLVGAIKQHATEPFDAVIEAVGKPEVWEAAVQLVRKGGKVNFFGGCPSGTSVSLDTGRLHYSNLTLLASYHHTPHTIRRALQLIESGKVPASEFISGECTLAQLPDLFRSMTAGNRAVKTLVQTNSL